MSKHWPTIILITVLSSIVVFGGGNIAVFAEENSFVDELATITVDQDTKVYSEPDQTSKGLAYVMGGDSIQQVAVSNGWIQVIWNNNYGYILRSDLKTADESEDNAKSPQERVIDDYFDAVNHLDRTRISELCNNDPKISDDALSLDVSNFSYFASRLEFTPGILYMADTPDIGDGAAMELLEGYGYRGDSLEEMRESFRADRDGDGSILFSDFHVSYELLDLKEAEQCKNYYMVGLKRIDIPDLKEQIKTERGIDNIDDIYVAKLKIYWEYNGYPYGYEEEIFDSPTEIESFESALKTRNDREYYEIVYKIGSEWYLYWDMIIKMSNSGHGADM